MDEPSSLSIGGAASGAVYTRQKQIVELRKQRAKMVAPFLVVVGLVIALLAVLFVPLLVSGTEPATQRDSRAVELPALGAEVANYDSVQEAVDHLDFSPHTPQTMPEGYTCTAARVLDNEVLEIEYKNGGDVVVYRTARGNEDLSEDTNEYAFSAIENVDGTNRSYSGSDENKLHVAVWLNGNNSCVVTADKGVQADVIKAFAESVN